MRGSAFLSKMLRRSQETSKTNWLRSRKNVIIGSAAFLTQSTAAMQLLRILALGHDMPVKVLTKAVKSDFRSSYVNVYHLHTATIERERFQQLRKRPTNGSLMLTMKDRSGRASRTGSKAMTQSRDCTGLLGRLDLENQH